jgi:glutamate carboxypeptidase
MGTVTREMFTARQDELVGLIQQLVEIESPTTDKDAVDQVGSVVTVLLRRLGARVRTERRAYAGDIIIGEWDGRAGSEGGLLTLCHLDTVYPLGTLARQPCYQADGRLMGPGTMDMKASVAMLLTALGALREHELWPERPVTALFTTDEETGSDHSRALIETLARPAALVLCLEPCLPDGSLKTWRKGVGDFDLTVRGRAAHAGADHERGRNAIEELAHQVLALQKLTDYGKGTTVNVGVVAGGTRSNVVPDEARAKIDMRVMTPDEGERITQVLQSLQPVLDGTTLEVIGGLNRPPMPRDALMVQTFERAKALAAGAGLALTEGGTGGGSDANFVAPLGVPVLDGLGAQGNGAHSEREHVLLGSLAERTQLLAALISGW